MFSLIKMCLILGCLMNSFFVEVRNSNAIVAIESYERPEKEAVYCYFGAFRKDGRIMVNMVEGAAGKVYSITSATPVTLNGAGVGQQYLRDGMPIILILRNRTTVDEIQVRPAGGN